MGSEIGPSSGMTPPLKPGSRAGNPGPSDNRGPPGAVRRAASSSGQVPGALAPALHHIERLQNLPLVPDPWHPGMSVPLPL